jgi:S1-C subfamily serine protease
MIKKIALILGFVFAGLSIFNWQNCIKDQIQINQSQNKTNKVVADELNFHQLTLEDVTNQQNILNDEMNAVAEYETVDIKHMLRGSITVYGVAGLGSGTVVAVAEGKTYILTCAHVIADVVAAAIKQKKCGPALVGYEIEDERGKSITSIRYAVDIIKYDEINDMALLQMYWIDPNLDVIQISNIYPQIGDTVYSVGNPLGVMKTLSKGILSNHKEGFYLSDNTTTYGNSGGSLYNRKGELIGIPSQVMVYSIAGILVTAPESSLGLSIDLYRIKEFLQGEI